MKFVVRALGAVALAAMGASCGGGSLPDPATYFVPGAPYSNSACNSVDGRLAGQREMRLFSSGSVDVTTLTQGLARYYQRHSLTFFTQAPEQPAGTSYALDTNQDALGNALVDAFPGVDLDNEAALMADPATWNAIMTFVANFMLRPMIDFSRAHGDVGTGATNLVVVPDLERPGGMKLGGPGTAIVGIAICPALLAAFSQTMADEGEIWRGVSLPAGFTPMMFLGNNIIRAKTAATPVLKDLVVAHEFGHASGLQHTEVASNLMFPSVTPSNGCTDSLDDTQLATMRANLGVGAAQAGGALSGDSPAAEANLARRDAVTQKRRRFMPADLHALLTGDEAAMRRFLGPLIHEEPAGQPIP